MGDFPYEFYDEDMGPSGEMVTAFESIAFVFGYEPESLEEISDSDEPKIAFEKAIFSEGTIVRIADRDISGRYVLRTTKERLEYKYKIIISIR